MLLHSLRYAPVNELVTALRREVFFAEEVLRAFDVIVRAVLVLLRDPVIELVLQACVSQVYAFIRDEHAHEHRESCP